MFNIFLKKVEEAVKIKSISTDEAYLVQINKMVEWLKRQCAKSKFDVDIIKGYGNPIILAELTVNKKYQTVLHYGHYDVQPASLKDGWKNDPFKLTTRNGKFYARGVADNKGQFLIYLSAIEKLLKQGKLKYNIKFIIEGNEETGSGLLSKFIKDYKTQLKSDFALISDGEMINQQPTIDASYRGTINMELCLFGPKNDLHSGLFGGLVPNPINIISEMISGLTNYLGDTSILDISGPDSKDKLNLKNNKFDKKEFEEMTGYPINDMDAYTIYKKLGFQNTIQITGISGGYIGPGFRNAIPSKANAKINIRFNAKLYPMEVEKAVTNYFKKNFEKKYKYSLDFVDKSYGVKIDTSGEVFKKAGQVLKKIYKKDILYNYCGATLPIAHELLEGLKIPTIFVGLANADCNMHGANENFKKEFIEKGLLFAYEFLST